MLKRVLDGIRSFFLADDSPAGTPHERRRVVRVRTHMPVQVKTGERLQLATVVDLGVQGMRLRSGFSLKGYQTVPVVHTEGGAKIPVRCQVAWSRRLKDERSYSSGLVFVDGPDHLRRSWVGMILRELGLDPRKIHERREYIRAGGRVPVKLVGLKPDQPAPPVQAVNVGVGGLLLHTGSASLRPGDAFQVELGPLGKLPALMGLQAEVIKCTADGPAGSYQVAMRFPNPNPRQVRALGTYVLALLRS